jgi:hypothetical protein
MPLNLSGLHIFAPGRPEGEAEATPREQEGTYLTGDTSSYRAQYGRSARETQASRPTG